MENGCTFKISPFSAGTFTYSPNRHRSESSSSPGTEFDCSGTPGERPPPFLKPFPAYFHVNEPLTKAG